MLSMLLVNEVFIRLLALARSGLGHPVNYDAHFSMTYYLI